ncbi:MAG: caspase family protein [Pseudomonas sp.]|uniref:caspase family protein n=1 Tax=Pseudomonas sp. TaxID=306 RepID=UPI00271FF7F5|nr:caspase family protein [Pseudomonas sp.]MDO9619726.1 caspase family protein [Pseudomonas sp.]MDP2444533.1 caspase family protein [Pseudomonas sp.]MDZ4335513.1 caspase family protein [Pseudomonas sp.]
MKTTSWLALALLVLVEPVLADFRPPAFAGGIPGRVQMQAIDLQRHQARTLLYREALEELRRNPRVVDVRECTAADDDQAYCLPKAALGGVPAAIAGRPIERRVALLIGNNRYQSPIPALRTPIHDVERVAATLKQVLGFELRVLNNASKADIVRAVAALAREMTPADAVFVYYAGHGYLMDDTEMGYWIPSDGSVKTAAQWISNQDIAALLRAIPARQVLLVSDSCFSGTLVRGQTYQGGRLAPGEVLRKRSVLVLSSGGEEPVSDEGKDGHSIFAWHLLRSLQGLDATVPGFNLYQVVRRGVSQDYPQQPQYGAVAIAGHEAGGEYLFERLPN